MKVWLVGKRKESFLVDKDTLRDVVYQPVYAFFQTLSVVGRAPLDAPVPGRVHGFSGQVQLLHDLVRREGGWQVLLVCEDEQSGPRQPLQPTIQ